MKAIIRSYGTKMPAIQRQTLKAQAADLVRTRGTGQKPQAPQDLFTQAGPRGILLNWRRAPGFTGDISGYRIYKDDETSLFAEVHDPNTTQHFIDATAGTTPPVTNLFVSAVNKLGIESPKVQIQATAIAETGAPSMPTTPITFNISAYLASLGYYWY